MIKQLLKGDLVFGAVRAFFVKVLAAGGSFLLNIIVARLLGAEEAGYFFLAQAILLLLAITVRQGLDNVLVRFIAGFKVDKQHVHIAGIYRLALMRVVPVAVFVAVLLAMCSELAAVNLFEKPQLRLVLLFAAFTIIPVAISQLHSFCFLGEKRIPEAMFFQQALLNLFAIVLLFGLKPDNAATAVLCYLVASLLVMALSIYRWNSGRIYKLSTLPLTIKADVSASAKPLFVIVVLTQVIQWLAQLMLGAYASAADVALFATAMRTAMLTSLIFLAINAITAPKFAEHFKLNDMAAMRGTSIQSSRLMVLVTLPVIVFILVFAPWLMSLFGDEFVKGANILRILALGQFINVVTGSVSYLLQMTGHEKVLRNSVIISSSVTVIGCCIAIPIYGISGAAWVTAIAVAMQNLLCVVQVKKHLGFNTLAIWKTSI